MMRSAHGPTGCLLAAVGAWLLVGSIGESAPEGRSAGPATEETPTEAALSLLFARDAETALRYVPLAFERELRALEGGQRQRILGNLLFVRGAEAAGGRVERRQRKGKPEIFFELPGGRTVLLSLDKEVVEGDRATLECRAQRSGGPEEPFRVRMIREAGTWRLAGILGRTAPDPDSPDAIWAHLDNPRFAERMAAGERAANETAAIGDIRVLISAESAFAAASGGSYGTPECLRSPRTCIPGYTGPPMVAPPYPWTSPRRGYKRVFHPGPRPIDLKAEHAVAPANRLASYAIVAVPAVPGKTGVRGFCGDSTGRVCMTSDGSAPAVMLGRCPSSCAEVK